MKDRFPLAIFTHTYIFYSIPLDFRPPSLHVSSRRGHSSQDVPRGPRHVFWLQSRALEQPHPGLEDLQHTAFQTIPIELPRETSVSGKQTAALDADVPAAFTAVQCL